MDDAGRRRRGAWRDSILRRSAFRRWTRSSRAIPSDPACRSPSKLDWYFAYNLFRLAGIVQGIKKRVIDGTASHAHAAEMAKRVPMLAQAAWTFAVKAGAEL